MAVEYDAKVALKTLMASWSWTGSAPQIMWGAPQEADDQTQFEAIHFGDTPDTDTPRTLGWTATTQEFSIPIVIDVRQYGDDEQATEQRMWTLCDDVIRLLRANSTLNGTVTYIASYGKQPVNTPSMNNWRSTVLVTVNCLAVVTHP